MLLDHGLDLQYALEHLESADDAHSAGGMDLNVDGNVTVLGEGTSYDERLSDSAPRLLLTNPFVDDQFPQAFGIASSSSG